MIVGEDVKLTGEHWDEETGLYLDVDASVQRYPLWWDEEPERYKRLQQKRADAGVQIQDELYHWTDLDVPYYPEDHDE